MWRGGERQIEPVEPQIDEQGVSIVEGKREGGGLR
jgi:hypothetical protein